jgi:hypothetical protein
VATAGSGQEDDMGLNYRKKRRLGPLPIWRNVSRSDAGKTVSYSFKLGPFTWNSRTKKSTVDLPGGYSYTKD